MGVTGLWRLIEPAGKSVPVESLENKVLAVDISIWLHQIVKGYQDAKGAPLPNAHLLGLFQRLCKLLFFRIKPVFVFDGGFPDLKRETIAKRQDSKAKYHSESERLKRELALVLSKKNALGTLLGKQISPKKSNTPSADDDLFKLPALPQIEDDNESESDEGDSSGSVIDLHSVDMESESFKNLPTKEKYELLIELKETRKMNSWGKLHELPKKSDNFSDFQLQRLLKRKKVQDCLEETEKEMGDSGMSLLELESLLNEEGIDTKIDNLPTRRIASNDTTRILMINNVKQALAEAKQRKEAAENLELAKKDNKEAIITTEEAKESERSTNTITDEAKESNPSTTTEQAKETNASSNTTTEEAKKTRRRKKDELEQDLEKAIKLSLGCDNKTNTSANHAKADDSCASDTSLSEFTDSEEGDGFAQPDMSSAKAYIMQYSDFTSKAIDSIVAPKHNNKTKSKTVNVDKILEELKADKSVILDKVDLSSSDDDCIQETSLPIKKVDEVKKESIIEINSPCEDSDTSVYMNATQASVVCVDDPVPDVINLDTSTESTKKYQDEKPGPSKAVKQELHLSESSDGEFEEVLEEVEEVGESKDQNEKPVVQISLNNIGSAPEDDIFADVFDTHAPKNIHLKVVPENPSIKQNKTIISPEMVTNALHDIDILNKLIPKNIIETIEVTTEDNSDVKESLKNANKESTVLIKDDPFAIARPSTSGVKVIPDSKIRISNETIKSATEKDLKKPSIDPVDDDLEKALQMSLECFNEPDTSASTSKAEINIRSEKLECFNEPDTSSSTTKAEIDIRSETSNKPKVPTKAQTPISTEQLNTMATELQNKEVDLIQEKGRLDRIGRNITEQMTKEAQELLQIFGIPYIVAPMEAEAQCAFLESVNLTDGTITDDSDIWLFGGRTVYKNFFNQNKLVKQFVAERIERSFNLTREQLILLALLVGSDYTTGLAGVGPVTALEILASFPFNKKQFLNETSNQARCAQVVTGLQEFKKWVRAGKRTDNITLKKKLKNVELTDDFPSIRVVQAYLEPNVEKNDEKFTWGEIDITILRDYAKAKFGWSQSKVDEIIQPVLKRMLDRKTQRSMQDYFKKKVEFQSLEEQMSKRVKAAVQKMGPEPSLGEQAEDKTKPPRKRKLTKTKAGETDLEARKAGPKAKQQKNEEANVLTTHGVTVVSQIEDGKSNIEINIPKSDRFQEIIPQREKEKQSLLQNKMKAIEVFRKTKLDKKKKLTKRRVNLPKDKAELSESSDSN